MAPNRPIIGAIVVLPQPVASLHVLMFPDFTVIIIFAVPWSSAILLFHLLLMMRVWMVLIWDSSKCNEVIVSQSNCSFWFDVIIKDCCPHAAYFSCLDTEEYSVVFTCNFFIIKKVVHLLMTNFLITCLWKQFNRCYCSIHSFRITDMNPFCFQITFRNLIIPSIQYSQ